MESVSAIEKLESSLLGWEGVRVDRGEDEEQYISNLRDDIRRHKCDPFSISAVVMPPGFSDMPVGTVVTAECVAYNDGYWLVYQPEQDTFYCFWGSDLKALGAHGIRGGALYCWSA